MPARDRDRSVEGTVTGSCQSHGNHAVKGFTDVIGLGISETIIKIVKPRLLVKSARKN